MEKRLYIGNLSYSADEQSLAEAFESRGFSVRSATVVMDRETGRSRGFGFVELGEDADAQEAIAALDGQQVAGRPIKVNEARERNGGGGRRGGPPRGGGGGGYRPRH